MDTREVLSVDAFADEPLGGMGVPVLPGDESLEDDRLRAVASEFGATGAVERRDGELYHHAREGQASPVTTPVAAAVAGAVSLTERGDLSPGTVTFAGNADDTVADVEIAEDRTVTVALEQETEESSLDAKEAADALGIPTDAIADVDLPIGRATGAGGSLLVPVSFLENLSNLSPEPGDLAALLDEDDRLVGYTFDTLAAENDIHTRVFDSTGREYAASGVAAAGCGEFLYSQSAYEGEKSHVRVASGRFCDRPATLDASLDDGAVAGRALVSLDGQLSLPEATSDDIVEL